MKIQLTTVLLSSLAIAACGQSGQPAASAQEGAPAPKPPAAAPAAPAPSPEQQAAIAKQAELEKTTPQLKITEEVLRLVVPGHTIGEAVGVAKNSKGHLFVFTRSGRSGTVKGATAAQLFEFDPNLKFVKQWGEDSYAMAFAHTVRVDKDDNVWMTDEGSNMVVKFRPDATVAMVLGRKEEPLDWLEKFIEHGEKLAGRASGRPPRRVQPADRRDLGHGRQYLRRRRLQQLAGGQDVEGRHLGQGARHAEAARRTSSTRRTASPLTPRATSTSPTAATAASRCSIPI